MMKLTTKRDVDKHVTQMIKQLGETERSSRGLVIAKNYAKVSENELARDWLQRYLDIKPNDAAAHKLMGELYERLNKSEQAITSYQRAYTLNPKQSDLIKSICRLFLVNDNWTSTPGKAKYWCELADTEKVRDDSVLSLSLKMLSKDKMGGGKKIEDMILNEITGRPSDVGLRIRLVKFLLDEKRAGEAFKYCYDLEMKFMEVFLQSIDWYTTVSSVLAQQTTTDNWNYWCLLLISIDKKIYLSLKKDLSLQAIKQNNIKEVTNLLFEFDQVLKKSADSLLVLAPVKQLAEELINHFRGQMALNIASLLFQKEKVSSGDQWHDTTKKCLPFLLFALQCSTVNIDAFWLKNTNETIRNLFSHLKKEGAYRCAQAGRTILGCKSTANDEFSSSDRSYKCWSSIEDIFNQIRETSADLNWRKNIFRQLFANTDQQNKVSTSYLIQNAFFKEPSYEIDLFNDLDACEVVAQFLYPSSLEHQVYLGLGQKDLHLYQSHTFGSLMLWTPNIVNCNPETLNRIDIDSFLYCAIIQAKSRLEAEKYHYENCRNKPAEKPMILPAANMVDGLCTEEQNDWWMSAFKMDRNITGEHHYSQMKATLQSGIEAVRGIDSPKIDVIILLNLGDALLARSSTGDKTEERRHFERAEYIYKMAIRMLKMRESGDQRRIFKYAPSNINIDQELEKLTGNAVVHLSTIYFKRLEYKEFVEDFVGLKNPWAHYFLAEAYKKLDEMSKTQKKGGKRLYAQKACDNLRETLALLDTSENIDKDNLLRVRVEKELKRLQNDLSNSFDDLDFHNASQNGHTDDEMFHNASATSFHGRRDASFSPSYSEKKFSEVETLIRKLTELVTQMKDDVRNDISDLKDDLMSTREDIAVNHKAICDIYKAIEELPYTITCWMNMGNATQMPAAARLTPTPPQNPLQAQLNQMMYQTMYPMQYPMQYPTPSMMQRPPMGAPGQMPTTPMQYDPMGQNLIMNPQSSLQALQAGAQRSSLMEALNTPALLNTWNSSYNQCGTIPTPQPIQTMPTVNIPPQMVQPPAPIPSQMVQPPAPIPSQVVQPSAPIQNKPVEKAPPVNVVITSSDPLPAQNSFVSQPKMSVTIPPQHIKHAPQPLKTKDENVKAKPAAPAAPAFGSPLASTNPTASTPTSSLSFGGLTGSLTVGNDLFSSPVDTKAPTEKPKTPAQPSPFANFSFGQPPGNQSFTGLFGSLPTVASPAQPQSEPAEPTLNKSSHAEEDVDHYEPTAHFEPVIPLPDLIEAKTGEEDEKVTFVHRAKLLRFDKTTKEWKERGIGDMKVLVHNTNPNKARLLMRRDQIFKLCCNMVITKELKFNKLNNVTYSFGGQDFSEEEMKPELLAIKFKTSELVQQFLEAVRNAQANLGKSQAPSAKAPEKKDDDDKPKGFGDLFKAKAGSWDCQACYITNKPDTLHCVACETPKDSSVPKKEAKSALAPSADAPKFSFGMPATQAAPAKKDEPAKGFGDSFKPKAGSWSCEACYTSNKVEDIHCVACEAPKDKNAPKKEAKSAPPADASKFSFGVPTASGFSFGMPATTSTATKPTFGFGSIATTTPAATSTTSSFSFTNVGPVAAEKPQADSTTASTTDFGFGKTSFSFGMEGKGKADAVVTPVSDAPGFKFVFQKKSPSKSRSPGKSRNDSVNSEGAEEEYLEEENDTYFTPAIPLPNKIEVKTGEEDEEVLYSHRAKLYRYVDKEWKERGIGDMKILKHRETGKLRCLMRREQILKLCLNCYLTPEVEFMRKENNSWTFKAVDFSEEAMEPTNFAIRFKNQEISDEFKKAVEDALAGTSSSENQSTGADENSQLAARLKLPENFYDYLNKPDCSGCVGCKSDEYVYVAGELNEATPNPEAPLPLTSPTLKPRAKPPRRQSVDKKVSFKLSDDKELFGSGNVKEKASVFGGIKKSEATSNIFAAFNSENPASTSFGSPSGNIFGTITETAPVNSIFSSSLNTTPTSVPNKPTEPFTGGIFGSKSSFSFGQSETPSGNDLNNADSAPHSFGAFSTTPVFGSSVFGSSFNSAKIDTTATAPANIFGSNTTSSFSFAQAANELDKPKESNGLPAPTNLFGSGTTSSFSFAQAVRDLGSMKETNGSPIVEPDFIQKSNESGGFAALAATATPEKPWSAAGASGFIGLTVKDDFFSKNLNKPNNADGADTSHNEESANDANYDPHYDPIIPLPDEINISTGEEDEDKLFGERAKLYRYDGKTKEWKERGVGEFKILHHSVNGTYRMLMRREQIFKLVLNQLITSDLVLSPMNNSTKAFSWAGFNYNEENKAEPDLLAVRFKNDDLASTFKKHIDECINQQKSRGQLQPEND